MKGPFAICLLVGSVLGTACYRDAPPPRAQTTRTVYVAQRADARRDYNIDNRSDWHKLGELSVDGRLDRDAINLHPMEQRFRRLMLVVEHSALELYGIHVIFEDGSHFTPGHRLVFAENTRSREIDLPGGNRRIARIEFRYGNLPGGGKAQLEVWGR